jgi:ankyrin repeat protein
MRRQQEERQRALSTKKAKVNIAKASSWTPTQDEIDDWDAQVLNILSELEPSNKVGDDVALSGPTPISKVALDRSGNQVTIYRHSLPHFLKAAADGDLGALRSMVKEQLTDSKVKSLLNTKDRHLSTAEHWAAGGGHLQCLQFLLELKRKHSECPLQDGEKKKVRRRDGKTALHYAARNGHMVCTLQKHISTCFITITNFNQSLFLYFIKKCVKYLCNDASFSVDEPSGEKTVSVFIIRNNIIFK